MTPEYVVNVGRQALEMMMLVSAPALLVALGIGLVVSVLQAVTQINEATLTFLPKLIGVGITLVLVGPWMLAVLTDYIARTLTSVPAAISGN